MATLPLYYTLEPGLVDEATNNTVGAGMILQRIPPPGSELTEAPDRDFVI